MNRHLYKNIKERESLLTPELKILKSELELVFNRHMNEAGVITPGYYSSFYPILDRYKNSRVIDRYNVHEEEYSNDEKLKKIPVIDLTLRDGNGCRIFILSTSK